MASPASSPLTCPTDILFVYGTLRHGCDNDMARRLAAGSEWLGTGTLNGRLYHIDDYPGLVMDGDAPPVAGDIFRLRDAGAMLAVLDAYEEAGPDFPAPQEYVRCVTSVTTDSGTLDAWVYIYNWSVTDLPEYAVSII
jgi:gamma-glutamylcyclotransferase (GGCT)/AIG2-like uncharacterized protein YtfP